MEFLKGDIQAIPLPSNSVDVVISNCVINLAPDKSQVLAEAFRVLKPGGRFAVSDVIVRGEVSPALRRDMELWVGCIAGALDETDYKAKLGAAGFEDVDVETWRVYDGVAAEGEGKFASAFIRARKPRNPRNLGLALIWQRGRAMSPTAARRPRRVRRQGSESGRRIPISGIRRCISTGSSAGSPSMSGCWSRPGPAIRCSSAPSFSGSPPTTWTSSSWCVSTRQTRARETAPRRCSESCRNSGRRRSADNSPTKASSFSIPANIPTTTARTSSGSFNVDVCPVLTPLAFDPGHPFPLVSNRSKNLAVVVEHKGRTKFARVKVPDLLPRFVALPAR